MKFVEIVARLQSVNLSALALATGLHYNTVRDIARGIQKNPGIQTVEILEKYFEEKE